MKPSWQTRFSQSLTLRWRLTLWTAGLLFVLGLGLTLLINALTATRVPQAISVVLEPTQYPPASLGPIASPTLSLTQASPFPSDTEGISAIEQVQEIAIREVRIISLIGVGVFVALGAIGAYWISQQALRPIQRLSHMVQEVRAETLNRRLALDGPPDEVKELANAFDSMLERLERAFEQQGRFVADAAHELRTPLATLRTNLEVTRQDAQATLSDYRDMSATLDRAVSRLEGLVEDLLLLAKGEDEIQMESVNLEVLLTEVMQELEPLAQAHQVSLNLEVADEVVLPADAPLLARAINNLIENGIRYNHPGGSVTVTAHREANGVVVRVKDTGIGIPPDELPHIFERFYCIDRSRARHRGGSGLGLSITAYIVQLHSGRIRVESIPGEGSTFTIWLPCHESEFLQMQT